MPTSRQYGRSERQQAYAAARAAQMLARKARGRTLTSAEAEALTVIASKAAGGAARAAESLTLGRKYKGKKRRSKIRAATRKSVWGVSGGKGKSRRSRKSRKSHRGWTPSRKAQAAFRKTWTAKSYGPVPFAQQPKKTRKRYLRQWKRKGYPPRASLLVSD